MTDWDLVYERDCAVPEIQARTRALYLLADTDTDTGIGADRDARPVPLPHRDALKARLAEVLAPVFQHA